MIAYAEKLSKTKKLPLPAGYAQDFQACRRFLDQHANGLPRRSKPIHAT